MAAILIVDDDPMFFTPFVKYLEKLGHRCRVAADFFQGAALVREHYFDIVFLDVVLPDANGLQGIHTFIDSHSSPELIIITGQSEMSGAEMALVNGAWDYLEKPPLYDKVKLTLKRALQFRKNKTIPAGREQLTPDFIVGQSVKLKKCLDIAAKAAQTEGTLFITGETGTGKDLLATAVHQNSRRADGAFVPVDCTNLPENLIETLLFGHVKGAFTGAMEKSDGLITQADKGTLFLDEVGDLSPAAQKSILRVLQNKTFRPLGANTELTSDFRLISATNRNLRKMVENGQFRKDLYYRLVAHHIELPPLRERIEDIKPLTRHYIQQICDQLGIDAKEVSGDFIETLMIYDWKGNIRELINVLHTAIVNALNESKLNPHHLPVEVRIFCRKKDWEEKSCTFLGSGANSESEILDLPKLKEFRRINEACYLDALIRQSNGKVETACKIAGVSRSGLYNLLEKHKKKLKN